ncbi:MAG: beta-ketoacyl-[acyl-carrier-protein] synthase family protein [Thermoanaerobaculia bacterium]|nr:beta-ketoacyl-[acyl-carrier-protein] synthase family protein [Thermoanaerobaculia bacterium]
MTGVGLVSPLGIGKAVNLASIRAGRPCIEPIRRFDPSAFSCRIAGQVPDSAFDGADPNLDRVSWLAVVAANEAAAEASLETLTSRERIGVVIGTGLGGADTLDTSYERLYGQGNSRLHPLSIPKIMYNAPTSAVSIRHRARGPSFAIVSACSSGTHAIGQAAMWIRAGAADCVIAGGTDAPITPGIVRAWEALRVLNTESGDPATACRPFSADRNGIVLSEGAAVFVLERLDLAMARGARILGRISGFGMSSDAAHITDPQSDGAARAMRAALDDAALSPADVVHVNAHGTGTKLNDPVETRAIRAVFGGHADRLAVSSTKSMHGHAMGASGAIEAALSLLAMNERFVPPTANLRAADPECDLDYVADGARTLEVVAFLSNSFGFGGMNAVLAITHA